MADDFALEVGKFADEFIDGAEQAIRGTTIKLWSAIIKSSPVDTGRFRSNWFATGKQPSVKVNVSTTDKEGNRAIKDATNVVLGLQDWSVFHLTNNLPYSEVIEFGLYGDGPKTTGGFSKQSPQGVVRVNISRFNKLLDEEAKRSLPK